MRKLPEPRFIKPETVDIGDTIRVVAPDVGDGVERSWIGKVATREDNGSVRAYFTAERGRILTWEPGKPYPRVTLLNREPVIEEPALFDMEMLDEARERVS